jgi:carboxypeptidase Taq
MERAERAYKQLLEHLRQVALLRSTATLVAWDQQTHMPRRGGELRAQQLAQIAGLFQRRFASPAVGRLLEEARPLAEGLPPDADIAVILREAQREYDRAKRVPPKLFSERAELRSRARHAWEEARRENDFGLFRPWLEKVVRLMRRWAEAVDPAARPYDALLDEYEPGETTARLQGLFTPLREALRALVVRVREAGRDIDSSVLARACPIDRQRDFARAVAAAIGFDFSRGALDDAAHPFCSVISHEDVRLTSRYNERMFVDGLLGLLHEAGHGIYEQGLPGEHYGNALADACSHGIHESQSRLWENLVGRSVGFWRHFLPRACTAIPGAFDGVTPEGFQRAVSRVTPTPIRTEADEVTYNLHIFVRFELEQALLAGDLAVRDVPAAWNDHYAADLGITPKNDAEGCLQDVHWSQTLVGYFPTYTLGNLYAAQLHDRAREELGDLDGAFARGEFAPLLEWLRERVYRHGRRYPPARLIELATGAPPSPAPLLRHLSGVVDRVYG